MKLLSFGIMLVAFLVLLCENSLAFEVHPTISKPNGVLKDHSVILNCTASGWFEYCKWKHQGEICMFEWKRSHDKVLKQDCGSFSNRMKYVGNYNNHECAIEIKAVTGMDEGLWTCTLESYVYGVTRGSEASGTVELQILDKNKGVTNAPKDTIQTFHPENFDTSKSTSTTTENAKVDEEDANFRFDQNQDDTSGESDTTTANPNENMIGINDGHDDWHHDEDHQTIYGPLDSNFTNSENDKQIVHHAGTPLVPIILAVIATVFIIMVVALYAYKKRPNLDGFANLGNTMKMPSKFQNFKGPKISFRGLKKKETNLDNCVTSDDDTEDADNAKSNSRYLGSKIIV